MHLLASDEKVLRDDCRLLHDVEMKYTALAFQDAPSVVRTPEKCLSLQTIMTETNSIGSVLILSDTPQKIEGACVVSGDDLAGAYDSYEQGIIYLHEAESFADVESLAEMIYMFIGKIRKYGTVIVPESTYCNVPYGVKGMEILLRIAGLRIEELIYGGEKILIGTKV